MSGETAKIEFKEFVDFGERSSALKFIKEVVALANAGGGVIRVGIGDDGTPAGRPIRPVDAADLCNKVDVFISPDHLELSVEPAHAGSEYLVHVPPVARPPLVMVKDGTVGDGKAQTSIFRKGDVFVRTGTKAQAASRKQYLDWIEEIRTTEVHHLLCSAISGKDRDRSDAGNAIVEVAAVFRPDGDE